jgi:hypothetical protein
MPSEAQVAALLAPQRKRAESRDPARRRARAEHILADLCDAQREFVLDPNRWVCALTARQVGKTHAARALAMWTLQVIEGAQIVYIGQTREWTRELVWPALLDANHRYSLGLKVDNVHLRLVDPVSGGSISCAGADDIAAIEMYRGFTLDLVIIDECKSFKPALFQRLLIEIIMPTLSKRKGKLVLIGTPGSILVGPFYEITHPGAKMTRPWWEREDPRWTDEGVKWQWSLHRWTARDNPATTGVWDDALVLKEMSGWTDENPIWRREWLGQWAADDTERVYKYRAALDDGAPWNLWTPGKKTKANPYGLPEGRVWHYVYGLDLGWNDPTALEVLAYSDTHPDVFVCFEYSRQHLRPELVAELLKATIAITGHPDAIVADIAGLGGGYLDELQQVYGVTVEAAEKKQKNDFIELVNGDLVDGRMKVSTDCPKVKEEMETLQWDDPDPKSGFLKENKKQANHHCDAVVYARRKLGHRHAVTPMARPAPGSVEELEEKVEQAEDAFSAKARRQLDDFSDEDFGGAGGAAEWDPFADV